ncbi:MAG: 50S ribosomal protein L17, partial [Actinomycetota bacterium]
MPKPAKGPRLGSGPAHERLLLSGLAADLIRHERIRTTEAKAKRLKPVADRLVTLGKNGSVHARRQALSMLRDREIVHKLFAEVAPRYTERMGGYTRILKLGLRKGDAAPMALIEWVEGEAVAVTGGDTETRRRLGGVLRRRGRGEAEPGKASRRWRPEAERHEHEAPAGDEAPAPAAGEPEAGAATNEEAEAAVTEAAAPAAEEAAAPAEPAAGEPEAGEPRA